METLHAGLQALDSIIVTGCCSSLDDLLTYVYDQRRLGSQRRQRAGQPADGQSCEQAVHMAPQLMRQLLETILNTMIYEECRCQWSMSRPLLSLILLQPNVFNEYKVNARIAARTPTI